MTAKGKINASKVQAGDRIIIRPVDSNFRTGITPSDTKTGEGVQIARVTGKSYSPGQARRPGRYVIETTAGSFEAAPIQTMFLAPEDNAGIKRAHAEALAENAKRAAAEYEALADETRWSLGTIQDMHAEALEMDAERDQLAQLKNWRWPHLARGHGSDQNMIDADYAEALTKAPNLIAQGQDTEMHDASTQDHTGSAVVRTLEKVWARIREDHPELPEVVIVTGSGMVGASKWGHFRADGWTTREGLSGTRKHELFLAGEALAKGARQVLQTMLHEGAHTLARVRGIQDTSRQGRWHNKLFKAMAEEMGLEHRGTTADKSLGWSCVTLKQDTADRYADLMAELEAEIRLTCHLPGWLGGTGGEADKGGERIGVAPKGSGEDKPHSGSAKAVCNCPEPNIIRVSDTVLAKRVIQCDDCGSLFRRPV